MELDAEGYRQTLERVKKQTQEAGEQARKTARDFDALESALSALGASTAFYGLVRTVKSLTAEALELQRALQGMSEVARAVGEDVDEVDKAARELAEKGFMSLTEAATALKTSLSMGLTLQESINLIYALADAAAYNREAHYEWGEAIVRAIQGIKMGNSELTDAAGITTNLSVMYERYARQIGKSVNDLTELEKVQAAYNGMLQEAALYAGNAERALQGYLGTQATFNKTLTEARATLGEAFMPALEKLMQSLTPIIADFSKWAAANRDLVAGATASAAAVTGLSAAILALIPIVRALGAALASLYALSGPIGAIVAALGVVAAATISYSYAANAASESVFKFARSQDELNAKLSQSPVNRKAEEVKALQEDIETLNRLLERRKQLEEQLARGVVSGGSQYSMSKLGIDLSELTKIKNEIAEIDRQLRVFGINTPEKAPEVIKRLNDEVNKSVPALLELKQAELAELATKAEKIRQIEQLRDRYLELTKVEKLNEAQKAELVQVVNALKKEYPGLFALMDQEGRLHITNIDLVNERIRAEKAFVDQSAAGMKAYLENLKRMTQAQAAQIKAQIQNLMQLAKAHNVVAGRKVPPSGFNLATRGLNTLAPAVNARIRELENEYNARIVSLNEIERALANISTGNLGAFKPVRPNIGGGVSAGGGGGGSKKKSSGSSRSSSSSSSGRSPAEIQFELQRKAFEDEMNRIRFMSEYYDWSAEKQIQAFEQVRKKHAAYLKKAPEDERMLLLTLKRLYEDAERARFEFSVNWIEREKYYKRLSLEEELKAWERVRDRHKANAEFREKAEREIFRVQQELTKKQFDDAVNYIEREKYFKRMSLEEELKAWQQIRERFKDYAEYRERAEREIFRVEQEIAQQREEMIKQTAQTYKTEYEQRIKDALESAKNEVERQINELDELAKRISETAEEQIEAIRRQIEAVDEALKAELDALERQLKALEDMQKKDEREKAEKEHNERLKALQDQRTWYVLKGEKEFAFEIAALDKQIAEEQARWSEQLKQWQLEDERERIRGLMDAARERADARKRELQDQIKHIQKQRDLEIKALNEQKERLRQHWQGTENSVRSIMDKGVLTILADMAARTPEFAKRGEEWMQALIDGILSMSPELDDVISEITNATKSYKPTNTRNSGGSSFGGRISVREAFEREGFKVDWNPYTKSIIIRSSSGSYALNPGEYETFGDRAYITESKYEQILRALGGLPKAHTGAYVEETGVAILKKGEIVLPPELTTQFMRLADILPKLDITTPPRSAGFERAVIDAILSLGNAMPREIRLVAELDGEKLVEKTLPIMGRKLRQDIKKS